jgi:1,4-dihydroxy-2-naphthoyl-CoA hydrolase
MITVEALNQRGIGRLPGLLGLVVTHRESGKTIALFRCTQMILYPK